MALLPVKTFLGLRSGINDPEAGSASIATNFRRNRTRGQLELADGYRQNLDFTPATWANFGSFPVTPTIIAHKHFVVADHGGRVITAVLASYSKNKSGIAGSWGSTLGIFIRPFYNQTAIGGGPGWVDDWQEVTEFYSCTYLSPYGGANPPITVTFTNGTQNLTGNAVAANYFNGFTLIHSTTPTNAYPLDSVTGLMVIGGTWPTLTIEADNNVTNGASALGWTNGDPMTLVRSVYSQFLPSSAIPQFRTVVDEFRMVTGSSATDLDIAAFFRTKTQFPGATNAKTLDALFGEYASLNVPVNAVKMNNAQLVSAPTGGIPAGTYTPQMTIRLDDAQETELRTSLASNVAASMIPQVTGKVAALSTTGQSICTDGTYYYAIGVAGTVIYKIDPVSLSPIATLPVPTAPTGLAFGAIGFVAGNLYALIWRNNGATSVLLHVCQISTSPLSITNTFGEFSGVGGTGNALFGSNSGRFLNGRFYQICTQNPSGVVHYLSIIDAASGSLTLQHTMSVSPAVTDAWRILGESATEVFISDRFDTASPDVIYRVNRSTGTENTVSVTGSSGNVSCGTVDTTTGLCYVAIGSVIWTINISSYAVAAFTGSILGNPAFGMTSDGATLFVVSGSATPGASSTTYALALTGGGSISASFVNTLGGAGIVNIGSQIFQLLAAPSTTVTTALYGTLEYHPAAAAFVSSGYVTFQFDLLLSPGLFPRRGYSVCLYMTNVATGAYYFVKEFIVTSGATGAVTFSAAGVTVNNHRFFVSPSQAILASDITSAVNSAINVIGRSVTDTGIGKYSYAITANNRTYAIGRVINSKIQRNRVYLSCIGTAFGTIMYDVLPNDAQYVVNVDYNDGDYCVALGNVAQRVLVLKSRSLVMLTPNADGSHSRDLVSSGVGIAALNSLVAYNESLYWLDHSGVWQFNANGLMKMSNSIDKDLFALTNAQRIAAFGAFDPKNSSYKLYVNGTLYSLDLADGEWTSEVMPYNPIWFDRDFGFGKTDDSTSSPFSNSSSGRRFSVTFTGVPGIYTPIEDSLNAVSCEWRSSKFDLPLERGYDGLLAAAFIEYDMQSTTPPMLLNIYVDESNTPCKSYPLPTSGVGKFEVTIPISDNRSGTVIPSVICKFFKIGIASNGTITSGQKIRVKRMGVYFNQIPVGGSQHQQQMT